MFNTLFNTILSACLAKMVSLLANDTEAQENLRDELEAGRGLDNFARDFCDYYWEYIETICYEYRNNPDALPIIADYLKNNGGVLSDYNDCMNSEDVRAFFLRNAMWLPVSAALAANLKLKYC
jgi:hypothetical protein